MSALVIKNINLVRAPLNLTLDVKHPPGVVEPYLFSQGLWNFAFSITHWTSKSYSS